MPDQTPPAITRANVIAAIDAAAAAVKPQIDPKTSFDIPLKNVRKRLGDYVAKHGRMPMTLKELASLEVSELSRFKFIALDSDEADAAGLQEEDVASWPLSKVFIKAADFVAKYKDLRRIPNVGHSTIAIFYVVRNVYAALGLHTAPESDVERIPAARSPLVTAWREASAGLKDMDVVAKLECLLTQPDDIIAANSQSYFKALKSTTEEYYGTFLTQDLIGSPENVIITRHVVAKHIEEARRGRTTKTVLQPYIGSATAVHQALFIRSYLMTIQDDMQQGVLHELPLKIRMLGRLDLKISEQQRSGENPVVARTRKIAADVVATASKALEACVDSARIADAIEIMDALKNTVSSDVVVSSDSFQRLLNHVVTTHVDYAVAHYQAMHETLVGHAKRRQELHQLTPEHTAKLDEMAGHETGVRKAMMGRLAQRLTAKPDKRNEKA